MSLSLSQLFKTCLDLEDVTIPQSVQGYTEKFQLGCRVLTFGDWKINIVIEILLPTYVPGLFKIIFSKYLENRHNQEHTKI